jgi:hypothetical protein
MQKKVRDSRKYSVRQEPKRSVHKIALAIGAADCDIGVYKKENC